jgi:hypothetical protein
LEKLGEPNPKCKYGTMQDMTIRKDLDDYKTVYIAYRNFAEQTREEYIKAAILLLGNQKV